MNVFHLTWYPGEPLRRINGERVSKCLCQHGGHFAVHSDRSGFRSRLPGYSEKRKDNKRGDMSALTPEKNNLGRVGKHEIELTRPRSST